MAEPQARRAGHEPPGIDARLVLSVGAGVAVVLLLVVGAMYGLWRIWLTPDHARMSAAQVPPLPRLQATPQEDLAAMNARTAQRLTHYAWLDRRHEFARIPIDRAMALLAQRPAGSGAPKTQSSGSQPPSPSSRPPVPKEGDPQ